jgi:anaerobic selenocysteine-containing dehydrogenase
MSILGAAPARQIVHGVCPHDCPDTCGMRITVEDGRAVRVEGDPTHPITRGFLCVKVNQYIEHVYSDRRILTPHRRVGPKGSGQFAPITWDEALDEIAARFTAIAAEHGGEAILPYSYSGTLGLLHNYSMDYRFFYRLGATLLQRTICTAAAVEGNSYTLGSYYGTDPEHFPDAKLIICWGTNPVTSNPHMMPFIKAAQDNGAMLVVIDPRRTRTAERADWHLQPNPGSDAALALGLMHVIIAGGLHDEEYVRDHTLGFDELRERAAEYPPERVAELTGISAEDIVRLARLYATIKPAVIRLQYGMQRHSNGGMLVRVVTCLPAVIGSWRDPAGGLLMSCSGAFGINMGKLQRPDLLGTRRPRSINMIQLGDALLDANDPPVKALYVYNADPVASTPDSNRVLAGLARDDLFTVVHDPYWTDTTRWADLVLPATTQLEQTDLHKAYGNYYLQLNRPAIAPLGESKPNTEVFRLLAARMGFTEPCFRDSDDDLINQALDSEHPHMQGITRELLERERWVKLRLPQNGPGGRFVPFAQGGFDTPSGKVEFYSKRLRDLGHDPLPTHVPLVESAEATPELHARYPLTLITSKAHHFINSSFNNVDTLTRREGRPIIEIHPDDAATRGIADGDPVRVFNDRGECRLHARVTDGVRPGVAASPATWWASKFDRGSGINALTPSRPADMGGGATFYTNLVQVERAVCPPDEAH